MASCRHDAKSPCRGHLARHFRHPDTGMIRALRTSVDAALTVPFVISAVLALWVIGLASHSILHGPTQDLLARANFGIPTIQFETTWYPVASRFWCADLAGYLATTALLIGVCAPAERRIGSARTATLFVLTLCSATAFAFVLTVGRDAAN